uniref:Peptidase M20 dimerisation domain-containing protein n=1 Tax=Elphidium margaritaceum TaxID=933848 RepID=A0A7S0XRC0_9EUKA
MGKENVNSVDVVELAMQLIDVESVTNNEYAMAQTLQSWLEAHGFTVELQFVAHPNRYNVLAYPKQSKPELATIIINSHIDTVPPYFPASIKDNKIFGRGACDTKSIIAAQLIAAHALLTTHGITSIALLYTVGEEHDSIGMQKANELSFPMAKFMITGEPTNSRTISGQKGCYMFSLKSKGTAAHSAYPEKGLCALTPLLNVLHAIQNERWPTHKLFGETTVNIHVEDGGVASNVIAGSAEATILFRISDKPFYVEQRIKQMIARHDAQNQITYHKICLHGPLELETVDVEKFKPYVVAYTTDIPVNRAVMDGKCKAVLFGPGSIEVAHSDHEHIDIEELKRSVQSYQDIVLTLLKRCGRDLRSKM